MSLLGAKLQSFMSVYETSSVTAAAIELRIGQTAVTQRIRSLEQDLGVSLFTRSRKGMRLTAEGQVLLKYCLRTRELESQALSELSAKDGQGQIKLRMAGPTSFISGRAIPACKTLLEKWSSLDFQFLVDDRENRIELLKEGRVDLVVLYPHQVTHELDSKRLRSDEYLLLGHPSWAGRELKEIITTERLFAFHEADLTSINYLKHYDLLRFLKKPRWFVNENLALGTLLCQGLGFGLLAKEVAKPFLDRRELIKLNGGRSFKDELALAWYPRAHMPAYFREMVKALS